MPHYMPINLLNFLPNIASTLKAVLWEYIRGIYLELLFIAFSIFQPAYVQFRFEWVDGALCTLNSGNAKSRLVYLPMEIWSKSFKSGAEYFEENTKGIFLFSIIFNMKTVQVIAVLPRELLGAPFFITVSNMADGDLATLEDRAPGHRLHKMTMLPGMGIPMLKIRRSRHRLIFNTGIPILIRHLYIETVPVSMLRT